MVGNLSKYQTFTITSADAVELRFSHSLGEIPKIILLHSNYDPGESSYATEGVFTPELGACQYVSTTSSGNYGYTVVVGSTGATNATVYLNTDIVIIRRQGSARVFNPNAVYTVELYA